MNDRKIIWIIGRECGEGKYWCQSYMQSLYRNHREARFDITNKTAHRLHISSRCAPETTDISIFIKRHFFMSEEYCFSLLK